MGEFLQKALKREKESYIEVLRMFCFTISHLYSLDLYTSVLRLQNRKKCKSKYLVSFLDLLALLDFILIGV